MCLKFAKGCLKVDKFKPMFPRKKQVHSMLKRDNEKFIIRRTYTKRHKKSAIPHMQRLLNRADKEQRKILSDLDIILDRLDDLKETQIHTHILCSYGD